MVLSVQEEAPVVIVTGGLSGIGAAVSRAFAEVGARLVVVDRAAGSPPVEGAVVEVADVRDHSALASVAARTVKRWGRIDVLVANAGIADQSSMASGDPERWRAVVETNLLGTMFAIRAVLPWMVEQSGGHVFMTSSVSGRESYAGEAVYIASKWGQVGLAHALRQEVMDEGIRVTVVEPGIVDTPLTRDNPVVKPLLEATEPLQPENVAAAVLYAWQQPPHVVVSEVTVRPLRQRLPDFGRDR